MALSMQGAPSKLNASYGAQCLLLLRCAQALRFAVFDGPKAETAELLGSCILGSERFWPSGAEAMLQLAEESPDGTWCRVGCLVATPESCVPHQFAAVMKESTGTSGLERFEAGCCLEATAE
eukprot:Skav209367  [mRNA]  locus=scaffold1388:189323:192238:- [translate_table: standard]